jgi:hypothetical protein
MPIVLSRTVVGNAVQRLQQLCQITLSHQQVDDDRQESLTTSDSHIRDCDHQNNRIKVTTFIPSETIIRLLVP